MESSTTSRYVCHLRNVVSPTGEIDLGRGLSIRQLSRETLELLLSRGPVVYEPWQDYEPWFLVSEHFPDQTKWVDGDPMGVLRVFRHALILYFGEQVGIGGMVELRQSGTEETAPMILMPRWSRERTFSSPDHYEIQAHDVRPITILFENLVARHASSLLSVPLRWLSSACEYSASPADAIIALSIALEALYLDRDPDKGESLARRGSAFLGVDEPSRQHHYIHLRAFYRARNQIVH